MGKNTEEYQLLDIRNNKDILHKYISKLDSYCPAPLHVVADYATQLCPELKEFHHDENVKNITKKNKGERDKGLTGKYSEILFFGNMPNTSPLPDLVNGYDCKTTHFKNISNIYNAKERLSITNCGNTNDYLSFNSIVNNEQIVDCPFYSKISKGIIFVFDWDNSLNFVEPIVSVQNKTLLSVFMYDFSLLNDEDKKIIDLDYQLIRESIQNQNISQKNQKYLHIHKHGRIGTTSRAFGFTRVFVTKLTSIFTNKPLIKTGKSYCLDMKKKL